MLWIWWVLETRFIVSFTHRSTHAYAHTLSHFLLFWPVKLIFSPLSHMLQRTVWVQNWPVCSPDLWPIKTVWNIMKGKIWQSEPWSVEQLLVKMINKDHSFQVPRKIPRFKNVYISFPLKNNNNLHHCSYLSSCPVCVRIGFGSHITLN